ncbi:MAG: Trk family potassium uptake protein [Erysipelotrichaceae bacterium]|nr:Trk family potassium uptake protein [Erysipelotrichaceae bacterium]
MNDIRKPLLKRARITSFRLILFGFLALIMIGTFLLMLPISSRTHQATPFLDCLFTATSASCVTGLTVLDTGNYWSQFGKFIIFIMIQIGGLGVITMTIALVRLSGRKISIYQRSVVQDSLSVDHGGGVMKMISFIIKITLLFEGIGALLLMIPFCKEFGLIKGMTFAVFHAVSAFCNAGFDLFGNFQSLTTYLGNTYINLVIMTLIIFGGIGFYTWQDVKRHRFDLKNYTFQSKVILYTSFWLFVIPAIYFCCFEYTDLYGKERVLASLFQSVTCRTAGFNTTDLAKLSNSASLISIILMLIGGCPGSTAGGMKTTTIAVLILSSVSVFSQSDTAHTKTRRIPDNTVKAASAIFLLYVVLFIFSAIFISSIEDLPLIDCLFETASAIGTVGITKGITTLVKVPTRIILIFLMFFGRVGCLTLIYAALPRVRKDPMKLPMGNINVG